MAESRRRQRRRKGRTGGSKLAEMLVDRYDPSFRSWHVPEPKLVFAHNQLHEDPKTGLAVFGPLSATAGHRTVVRLGIVGTGDTIQTTRLFLQALKSRVVAGTNAKGKPLDRLLHPDFPGLSFDTRLQCEAEVTAVETLTQAQVKGVIDKEGRPARVEGMVKLVSERTLALAAKDPAPDVILVVLPQEIRDACGGLSVPGGRNKVFIPRHIRFQQESDEQAAARRQSLLFTSSAVVEEEEEDNETLTLDFHNALKATIMKGHVPIQLIWEPTLRGARTKEDPATIAWNIVTALMYKAGNIPWQLNAQDPNTCFVGISFFQDGKSKDSKASLAQAFAQNGEGIVLKGENAAWDPLERQAHLSQEGAKRTLERVLADFKTRFQGLPRRVVIHKTSRYSQGELTGFRQALEGVHTHDFLALTDRGIRLMRMGKEPPLRGTVAELGRRDYAVFTIGYVPYVRAYPGMRIPSPIEICEHHGDSDAEKVCSEVIALTKLNWNNCRLATRDPITIAFSKKVASILREFGDNEPPENKYRFFM